MAAFSVTEAMVGWLSALGFDASTRAPSAPGGGFVTVERVGGGVENLVDRAEMAVQAWAADEPRAEALANSVRLAALTSRPPAGVHSVRVESGPYPFFDDATRMPRYQLVLAVSCQVEV